MFSINISIPVQQRYIVVIVCNLQTKRLYEISDIQDFPKTLIVFKFFVIYTYKYILNLRIEICLL